MVRKLAAALLGVGVFIPGLANALGLGEIRLNSALSEPLDAEIELVQMRELTATEILPSIASNDDFQTASVERSPFLSDLKFEVMVNEKGKSVIRVRSRKPVKEPFLNFLVEVNWPAGRLLREYTLFLDPPIYSERRAQQPVQQARAATPAPAARTPAAAPSSTASTAIPAASGSEPAAAASGSAYQGGRDSHTITSNDSLWGIAKDLKPSADVSMQQTMIALQRINPDAFIDDNINLMRKGQVLRAPTPQEAREVSSREAIEMVAEQNRLWREKVAARRGERAAPDARQIDLTGRSADQDVERPRPADDGRLKLMSGTSGEGQTGQGGAEAGSGELRNKLAVAEENIDKFRLENDDLKVKMTDLKDQLQTSEKVLSLKDQQIAALQAKLQQLEQQAAEAAAEPQLQPEPAAQPEPEAAPEMIAEPEPAAPVADEPPPEEVDFNYQEDPAALAEPPADELAGAAEPETATESEPAIEIDEEPPVVVEQPSMEAATEPAPAPVAKPDLLTELLTNPLYLGIGAGAIVLLLVAGLLAMRRKKSADDEMDDALVDDFQLPDADNADRNADLAMDFDEPDDFVEAAEDVVREETVPQTADVVGEADIYIAYGRYPQAIEMLQKAAEKEPGRADIRLKLCEVCAEANEPEIFMTHYRALQNLDDAGALRKAESLRARIAPGDDFADFAAEDDADATLISQPLDESFDFDIAESEPAATRVNELEPEDTGLDFDLGDLEDTGARFAGEAKPADVDEPGLDFDLSLDLDETDTAPAPTETRADNSLDFDFDDAETEPQPPLDNLTPARDDNVLDFDAEFSLDEVGDDSQVKPAQPLAFDEDLSLDFDQVETEQPSSRAVEDDNMDFDLDFETDSVAADDDRTLMFTPSAPAPEAADEESTLDSKSAAQLADELDLDGDFLSHDEDATIQAPALGSGDFAAPAAPQVPPVVVPVAPVPPQTAANDYNDTADELDFLSDADETSTKLDLARAYIDMGDRDGARDILDEVLIEGSDNQKQEAKELLNRLES